LNEPRKTVYWTENTLANALFRNPRIFLVNDTFVKALCNKKFDAQVFRAVALRQGSR
jgi:hypothetical protein